MDDALIEKHIVLIFLISVVCQYILEKLLLKLSVDNEDQVMEGLPSSCSWVEFLCFRSGFTRLFMDPVVLPEHPALKGCSLQAAPQQGSAGLLSPVFASDPEPLQALQLDLGQGRERGPAGLPTAHPRRGLSAELLPTKEGFFSCLAACLETPEAETQITRLAGHAACSFEGKL